MLGLKVGYARVSTTGQDLTAQREALIRLGVQEDRIYVDHGLTGTNRARPGLREAMVDCSQTTRLARNARRGGRADGVRTCTRVWSARTSSRRSTLAAAAES